jgi:hypothetical protein
MKLWIIFVQDPLSKTVTDVVALSELKSATEVASAYRRQAGRKNVSTTAVVVDELPAFIGLVQP